MRFCEKFLMLARMFAHLDVSREEFVLMRATILLNAGTFYSYNIFLRR